MKSINRIICTIMALVMTLSVVVIPTSSVSINPNLLKPEYGVIIFDSEEAVKNMAYADAQKHLMQIKGVGPKVADCVLLFSCEKWESFPKDVWINRAMEQLFPDGLPRCVEGLEGIAQQYIFHYARFNLEK